MDWFALIGMTIIHTFWMFYLAGDIPGTAEHQRRHKDVDTTENQE